VLITAKFAGASVSEVIVAQVSNVGEDVLQALFAFETINKYESMRRNNSEHHVKVIQLSIESGVLCSKTAFVSNTIYRDHSRPDSHLDAPPRLPGGSLAAASPPLRDKLTRPAVTHDRPGCL
jgi:hypothetical protein